MEESEKRRERLRAMRTEASQVGASNEIGSEIHQLSNPFTEPAPSMQASSPGTPRFDYYTDPMAAFSNDKRMSKGSYQNSPGSFNRFPSNAPRNPQMTPSPAHQVRPAYSPDPRMYPQPPSPYHSSGPMHPNMNPSPAHNVQPAYFPDPRMFRPQSPYHNSGQINHEMTHLPTHHGQPPYSPNPRMYQQPRGPYYNSGPRNSNMSPSQSPAHHGQSGHFQARGPYDGSYANIQSPGFRGTPRSETGRGSRPLFANSPMGNSGYGSSPNSGRGRGRSGSGRGGNRGVGSHGNVSAELRPDLYYNKSMLEDPWKNLEPSIWKVEDISVRTFNTPQVRTFSHLDSCGTKKAKISEFGKESSSQPSLAEYLAAAFNETVGEEGNKEEPIL